MINHIDIVDHKHYMDLKVYNYYIVMVNSIVKFDCLQKHTIFDFILVLNIHKMMEVLLIHLHNQLKPYYYQFVCLIYDLMYLLVHKSKTEFIF
jgi:hypothetical protein